MQPEFLEVEDVLQIHITRNHPLPTCFERIRFGECGAWLSLVNRCRSGCTHPRRAVAEANRLEVEAGAGRAAPDAAPCPTNARSAVNRRARSGELKRMFKIWQIGLSQRGGSDGDRGARHSSESQRCTKH